ncbi:MAG: transposase [Verrucomicrobiota bacterium]
MSQKERRHFSGEEKVRILRQHLLDAKPVSEVSEQHGITPGMFYQWQKAFFENGARAFEGGSPGRRTTDAEKRVQDLEQRLQRKHEAISELMEEHIRLKKELGET